MRVADYNFSSISYTESLADTVLGHAYPGSYYYEASQTTNVIGIVINEWLAATFVIGFVLSIIFVRRYM